MHFDTIEVSESVVVVNEAVISETLPGKDR